MTQGTNNRELFKGRKERRKIAENRGIIHTGAKNRREESNHFVSLRGRKKT